MALPPHTPLVLLAAIVGSGVGFFVFLFRDTPGTRPLAVFMIAASIWSLAEGLTLASAGLDAKVFWTKVIWTISPIVPLAWLGTVLRYTGTKERLTDARLGALAVEPVAFALLVWTNDGHDLVWQSTDMVTSGNYVVFTETFGIAFWAHVAYLYALVFAGALLLVRFNFRTSRPFRSGGTALLLAIFVPVVANALSIFHLIPPVYDLASVGFVFTGIVVTATLLRGQFGRVRPGTRELGRDALIDDLDDQVVIVDEGNRIVDVNPAAADLLDVTEGEVVGQHLETVQPALAEVIEGDTAEDSSLELTGEDGVTYYDVGVSPLYSDYSGTAGRLISLRDVTERERRRQRLDVLNRLLRHNVRNEMNVVRGNVELLGESVEETSAQQRIDRITGIIDTVTDRSDKVGRLFRIMESDKRGAIDVSETCREAIADARESEESTAFVADIEDGLVVEGTPGLRFAIEELVDNAVTHTGDGATIELRAVTNDGEVIIEVADDGPGIPDQELRVIEMGRETELEHGSGVGLWLVAWATRSSGGRVSFDTDGAGTTVILRLPAADATVDDDAALDSDIGDDADPAPKTDARGDADAARDADVGDNADPAPKTDARGDVQDSQTTDGFAE